jgi:hypothetical protein
MPSFLIGSGGRNDFVGLLHSVLVTRGLIGSVTTSVAILVAKVTNAINQHWQRKNAAKRDGQSARLQPHSEAV